MDRRLLARLLVEGRISFRQVAREFGTSTSTISSRVSKLEKSGVITGFNVAVNFEPLGYDLTAVTEITVSKGKLPLTEKEIANLPGVCAVYDVTGEYDALVVAKFRSREELSSFAKGLLVMPFVERANTHVVLTTVKEDFRLPL
ncbi:MAG TPA: Lrp/AsnC family transcriptional regulator [Nitrososphaerales archaeon]|nr:Lrp/AsnC family transcriptional regulator [Nitrososphaerales archaeon]